MMFRFFAAIGFVSVLAFSGMVAAEPLTFPTLFGTWKVERVVGTASISADANSERASLGKTVTISAGLIKTYHKYGECKLQNPTIIESNTEEKLEKEFDTRGKWLALSKSTLKPRLPFLEAGCEFALILDHDTLLWPGGNGYIYTLKRQRGRLSVNPGSPHAHNRALLGWRAGKTQGYQMP